MKNAIPHIAVIEFTCPGCNEHLEAANGSHLFVLSEPLPAELECGTPGCGLKLRVPASIRKLRENN